MRVAFFTQGVAVPAARFRVQQLVPAFEEQHIECFVLPATPSVYGDHPGFAGGWRALAKPFSIASRLRQMRIASDVDAVWLQRPMTEYLTIAFERFVTARKPTVFDFDDAIFHNHWGLDARKLRAIFKRVDHIVAGNQYLYDFVDDPARCTIIPTVVDAERYTPREDADGPFTIVWTGMSHNLRELAPYVDAIHRVLTATGGRLVIVAERLDRTHLGPIEPEFIPWSPASEVTALEAGHVGVMPLADTPYNRGKCAFKLIQYMARAIPVVASPVGANVEVVRDGVEGFHAPDPRGWEETLMTFARDRDLRVRMGRAGRARVESSYSVKAVVPRYLDVLRAIA